MPAKSVITNVCHIKYSSFTEDTKMISINKTGENSIELVSSLAALHVLSGCDSVCHKNFYYEKSQGSPDILDFIL